MIYSEPARTTTRRIRAAGLLVAIAASAAALGYQLLSSSSSTASSSSTHRSPVVHRNLHRGAVDEADGAVPDGTTVFDDDVPGVANLDPAGYQEHLLRQAVAKYGSAAAAARWVATPTTSAHVSGHAVDRGCPPMYADPTHDPRMQQ